MQKQEFAFRNTYLFSKEELLQSIELMIEHIKENDDEDRCSEKCMQKKVELFNKFKLSIEKAKLPTLTKLWWFYEYEFICNAIELYLCSTNGDFEIDKDGYISDLTFSTENTLLKVNCEYLTIEQFADVHSVSPATVHQWICSGKLRHAKKDGANWFIPSVEDKPSRKYKPVQYVLDNSDSIQIDEFPIASACDSIFIKQQDNGKAQFICYFENSENHFNEQMVLSRKEVESLEYALISSGKAQPGSDVHYMPMFERNIMNDDI